VACPFMRNRIFGYDMLQPVSLQIYSDYSPGTRRYLDCGGYERGGIPLLSFNWDEDVLEGFAEKWRTRSVHGS